MSLHEWLTKYYTAEEIASLHPKVIMDGHKNAIVKLTTSTSTGVARVAYIGVRKSGKNGVSSHFPICEGPASPAVLIACRKWLEKEDKKP